MIPFTPVRCRRSDLAALWRATLLGVLLLCGTGLPARAQFTRFQNYTDAQGLGNLSVTTLAQDRAGYILVGTQGGLYRYDGTSFRADVVGLPADWIEQIVTDAAGRIWVATNQSGLYVGDGVRFERADTGAAHFLSSSPHHMAASGGSVVFDLNGVLLQAQGRSGAAGP